jgi:hypothetical protein
MKMIAVVLACLVTSLLSACATPAAPGAPVSPAATLATAQATLTAVTAKISNQCIVVKPFLSSMVIMNAGNQAALDDLTVASNDIGKVCNLAAAIPTAQSSFTVADLSNAVNAGVPALLRAIGASTLPQDQKTLAQLAVTAAQLALSEALQQVYVPAAPAPVAASAPLAA